MTSTDDDLRARRDKLVREHMDSENAFDFDTTLRTFDHPRYEIIATGQVIEGAADVLTYYEQTRAAFPDWHSEVVALHHADEAVIVEFTLRGTHQGSMFGETPSNRSFTAQMAAFFLFEGDRLVCERTYQDMATILNQLGLSGADIA
ncbi:MAG: ester cyclase [Pseudonocardiales bacterium]|nr:MAG: ester cyclase [Pseudonocardiales bacterium]